MYGGQIIQQPYDYRNQQATPSPQPNISFSPQPSPFQPVGASNLVLPPFDVTLPPLKENNLPSYNPSNFPSAFFSLPPGLTNMPCMPPNAPGSVTNNNVAGSNFPTPMPPNYEHNANPNHLDSAEFNAFLDGVGAGSGLVIGLSDSFSRLLEPEWNNEKKGD